MRVAALISSIALGALGLSACATYEVGETYEFAGEIEGLYGATNQTILKTDKGALEFTGQCESAVVGDKVEVELFRDMVIIDNNQKSWTLEKCNPIKASI